jgi:hypothetical protein
MRKDHFEYRMTTAAAAIIINSKGRPIRRNV